MISIEIKKGFDLNIKGKPENKLITLPKPLHVALCPERIPFIKPRLLIAEGDMVKIGTPIFEDKRNSNFRFLSPGSGKIASIHFGRRRVIQAIVIKLDENETYEKFDTVSKSDLETMDRSKLVEMITTGGLWPFLRALPYRDIAEPETIPPVIYVSLGAREPFQPMPEVYLKEKTDAFEFGIRVLRRLANDKVLVFTDRNTESPAKMLNGLVTHTYSGKYPADDPGVLLYHTKKTADENRAWYINGQDVCQLGELLLSGRYPIERTVALGGSMVTEPILLNTRMGTPLQDMAQGRVETGDARYIAGGIFRGYAVASDGYMGFYETALTIVPQIRDARLFDFARPGWDQPSYSRAFMSAVNKGTFPADTGYHGGERGCVACGNCNQVCPVDILPQLAYKSILADDVEEYLAHGLLDCVECGLCAYVCTSKIELLSAMKSAKAAYYKEQS
jgi:Na+-transporting NADH:ubiquinone oxidoreductase subunit A